MFGSEAAAARTMLQITYPMENGIVRNWDDAKQLWNYIFDEKLKIDPAGRYILLTEPPENPVPNLIEMCRVMLTPQDQPDPNQPKNLKTGGFGVKGVYVATQAVLALYAQGE
jgi:actin-related protein 2